MYADGVQRCKCNSRWSPNWLINSSPLTVILSPIFIVLLLQGDVTLNEKLTDDVEFKFTADEVDGKFVRLDLG